MLAHAWSQCLELTSLIKQVGLSLIMSVLKDRKKVGKQASHTETPKGNTNSCDSKVNMTINILALHPSLGLFAGPVNNYLIRATILYLYIHKRGALVFIMPQPAPPGYIRLHRC